MNLAEEYMVLNLLEKLSNSDGHKEEAGKEVTDYLKCLATGTEEYMEALVRLIDGDKSVYKVLKVKFKEREDAWKTAQVEANKAVKIRIGVPLY